MKRWSLKNKNKGAALLAVLVTMTVVSLIALIITRVTIANIEMKQVEKRTKTNFYSAEQILDELKTGLMNEYATDALSEAYNETLVNYSSYIENSQSVKSEFSRSYLSRLETALQAAGATEETTKDSADPTRELYVVSNYDISAVKTNCLSDTAAQACVTTTATDATYELDYDAGTLTLQNITVDYTDDTGYNTTITTDIVFETPDMTYNGELSSPCVKYALIADEQIDVDAANITVDGNVYAGVEGIVAEIESDGTFTGSTILTRGDLETTGSDSALSFGNSKGTSSIWAENVTAAGAASSLTLRGTSYISDDLTLAGRESTVSLYGNYYGYNFQQNYDAVDTAMYNAEFSSAMMINGQDSTLSLKGLNYLMLAGNTFISRGSSSNASIKLGESISVRTNQLAYYVPSSCLGDGCYTENSDGSRNFTAAGAAAYESYSGVSDITGYLNENAQLVAYYYIKTGASTASVNYYLNFADDDEANEFFTAYYAANTSSVNSLANLYADEDAIVIDDSQAFTLKGDVLYRTASGAWANKGAVLTASSWDENSTNWDTVSDIAVRYKSLQLTLSETSTTVTADNVRITNSAGEIDKTQNPLFETLVDETALETALASVSGKTSVTGDSTTGYIILVDNAGGDTYEIETKYASGIVIATGNVKVLGSFSGLIISGDTIDFASNATVSADATLVSDLLSADLELTGLPDTALRLKDFLLTADTGTISSAALGGIEVKDYLSYQNWTKSE